MTTPASHPTRKKSKRQRHAHDDQTSPSTPTPPASAPASLTSLPIEILAEILLSTCSPPTVLAVSRTCSFLYHSLAQNPAASFIWRGVRKTYYPVPLPEPDHVWEKSEADYAAFVFGGGVCEVCHKTTRAMYVSFAARIRLCGSWLCRRKFLDEFLVDAADTFKRDDLNSLWIPYVESDLCFHPSSPPHRTWPNSNTVLVRKTDWVKYHRDLLVYTTAEQTRVERRDVPAAGTLSAAEQEEYQEMRRVVKRCHDAIVRFAPIMELSARLIRWKSGYDREQKSVKKQHRKWTESLAEGEGWNLEDLRMSQTYGTLLSRKTSLFQTIGLEDVDPIRSVIETELLAAQEGRKRQNAELIYGEKLAEVKKIYERMRCGTLKIPHMGEASSSESPSPLIFPPLSVFCTLPSVRAIKGSPDPNAAPSNVAESDIKSPLATSLILADIQTWLAPVKKRLTSLLGYPNGWQSASTRTLPPLQRLTARFFCRRCGGGKVARGYQRELCLDFRGVCSHVCTGAQRKRVEERGQEAPEEDKDESTDTDDDHGQEERKGKRKKRSSTKTLDWKVDVFEKDEKAIRVIKIILNLTGLSEEDPSTASSLKGKVIRCMTCTGWIVMDFDTAIGHARRHESMEIQLLATSSPSLVTFMRKEANGELVESGLLHVARFAFERGCAEQLLAPSHRARKLREKVKYGCKHCVDVKPVVNIAVVVEKLDRKNGKGAKAMDFNGLRSHLREKHGIQDVRDEDFLSYSPC